MTYGEIETQSRAVAAYLQNTPGVKRGDRIALMSPNIFAFPVAIPVLADIISNTPVKRVITIDLGDRTGLPTPFAPIDERLSAAIPLAEVLERGAAQTYAPVGLTGEDNIFFQYTGGITGPSETAPLVSVGPMGATAFTGYGGVLAKARGQQRGFYHGRLFPHRGAQKRT
jgi:long-chain acyl-CoA synthetase